MNGCILVYSCRSVVSAHKVLTECHVCSAASMHAGCTGDREGQPCDIGVTAIR